MNTPSQCRTCRYCRIKDGAALCAVRTTQVCERRGSEQQLLAKPAVCVIVNGNNNCSLYHPRRSWKSLMAAMAGGCAVVLAVAGLLCAGMYLAERNTDIPAVAPAPEGPVMHYELETAPEPEPEPEPPAPPALTREDIEAVYREHVVPMIEETGRANRAAAQQALVHFADEFQQFHDGVERFVRDLTRFGSRFGTLRRFAADGWSRLRKLEAPPNRLESYIGEKFEEHVMPKKALPMLIEETLAQYMASVEANRNELLAKIDVALRTDSIPLGGLIYARLDEAFIADAEKHLVLAARRRSLDSIAYGMVSYLTGEVAAVGAMKTASALATGTAGNLSARVVAGGAGKVATAKAVAGGGAAGSTVGPKGTVCGIAAGLVIGIVIDLWLTARFEEATRAQITELLKQLHDGILHGPQDTQSGVGLQGIFREANEAFLSITTEALRTAMLGDK